MNYQIFSSYNFFFCNNVTYFHKSITYQHSVKTEPKKLNILGGQGFLHRTMGVINTYSY